MDKERDYKEDKIDKIDKEDLREDDVEEIHGIIEQREVVYRRC